LRNEWTWEASLGCDLTYQGALMAEVLRALGFIEGSRKIWGKWFKILHSSNSWHQVQCNNSNKYFLEQNSEFLKVPSHQSTLVTVSFIGQMLYLSHSEISLHIITAESNFGVETAETTIFASVFLKMSLLYQFLCWFLTQLTHDHVLVIRCTNLIEIRLLKKCSVCIFILGGLISKGGGCKL
jgi:hypothetical protein